MKHLIVLAWLILNLLIAWVNAKNSTMVFGMNQHERSRFNIFNTCRFIMAVVGVGMVYSSFVLFFVLRAVQAVFGYRYLFFLFEILTMELTYLTFTFLVVLLGAVVWVGSSLNTWNNPTTVNMLAVVWNTFALMHNTMSAIRNVPDACRTIYEMGKISILFLSVLWLAVMLVAGYFTAAEFMEETDPEDKNHFTQKSALIILA